MKLISLIDIDSKIPNLALMKLSAYYKIKGYEVVLNMPIYNAFAERVFASIIFEENKHKADIYKNLNITIGGSGTGNYSVKLPDDIEKIMPDYDLYNCNYSLGFTSRGCIRNCPFCIVRVKEGKFHSVADIYDLWDRRHKEIVLMDNNILASKTHFMKITDQVLKENLCVDFNQGLDFRFLDDDICRRLKQLKNKHRWRFAFDNPKEKDKVEKAIELLKKHGIKSCFWYVLVGFNTTWEEDIERLEFLKKQDQRPYIMRYKTVKKQKKYIRLAEWVNQPHLFVKMTFEEYLKISGRSMKEQR